MGETPVPLHDLLFVGVHRCPIGGKTYATAAIGFGVARIHRRRPLVWPSQLELARRFRNVANKASSDLHSSRTSAIRSSNNTRGVSASSTSGSFVPLQPNVSGLNVNVN